MFDESGSGFGDHDTARWCDRLHSLRHADVRAKRCVIVRAGTDLAEHDVAGVQPHSQRNRRTVSALHFVGELNRFLLYLQRRDTGSNSVVLQRDRGSEQRHDAVTSELLNRTAISLSDGPAPVEELPHDLTQPLGPQGGGQIHGPMHVSEEHGYLFVLGLRVASHDRGSASVTKPGAGPRLGTAPPACIRCHVNSRGSRSVLVKGKTETRGRMANGHAVPLLNDAKAVSGRLLSINCMLMPARRARRGP